MKTIKLGNFNLKKQSSGPGWFPGAHPALLKTLLLQLVGENIATAPARSQRVLCLTPNETNFHSGRTNSSSILT